MELTSPPDDINTVQDLMEKVWDGAPGIASDDRFSFETALVELAANVISHADAGAGVSWTLTVAICPERIEATLRDSGRAGEIDLDAAQMPGVMAESGRGIPIIQALVDDLQYERLGLTNQWKIARTLTP